MFCPGIVAFIVLNFSDINHNLKASIEISDNICHT